MTDLSIFVFRRGPAAKRRGGALGLVRAAVAAVARLVERRRARRALRLPLKHMSDAQLRDIGLRRSGSDIHPRL